MGSAIKHTVRVTRQEYWVSTSGADYAQAVEVQKAIRWAEQDATAAGIEISEDLIKVRPHDDAVIIYFEIEDEVPSS